MAKLVSKKYESLIAKIHFFDSVRVWYNYVIVFKLDVLCPPGSWHGSWVLGPGSWVLGPGSWVLGPGSYRSDNLFMK
jgi:hypothetical protein